MLNADELQDIAINKYFRNVDEKNIEGVLATLNKDAVINIVTDFLVHSGSVEISNMLKGYFNSYSQLWHGNFKKIVDENNQSIVLKFDWKIVDKNNQEESGSNVNVFQFEENKISKIWIYMSTKDNPLK